MNIHLAFAVTSCCLWHIFCQNGTTLPLKELNVMTFIPMTGSIWPGGRALVPALDMALREINAREDVLPGYKLNLIQRDGKCDTALVMNLLYNLLYSPPTKVMIIGPGCSVQAQVQAEVVHTWNISNLAYGALSPVLVDKKRFPRFFRILPSDSMTNFGKLALLKHFNWQKVATLTIAIDLHSATIDDLVLRLKEANIKIISQEIYDNDPTLRVQNLKQKDARVILSASYEPTARLVLCAAYRVGLYGPKIVWIFPGWYNPYWWRLKLDSVPCTQQEMDKAAEGHLSARIYYVNPMEEKSVGRLTASEFEAKRLQEPAFTPETETYSFLAPSMYDTVWGCALALNCTIAAMMERGYTKTLDQFEYSDGDVGNIITECISNLSFMGVTGAVKFDETGEPLKNIRIEQIQDMEKITVGRFVLEEEERYLEWLNGGVRWPGGVVPRDSTQVTMVEQSLPLSLYIPMSVAATIGNLLAIGLLVFNVIYRKHPFLRCLFSDINDTHDGDKGRPGRIAAIHSKYVKLSSPNINNVLVCGCFLTYSSVYMHSSVHSTALLCKVRHFTFTTGFTLAFGAMFSKTWRVYKIFCNKKLLRVKINDVHLIAIVVVMVTVMVLILIIWEGVDALVIRTLHLDHMAYKTGADAIAIPVVLTCTSAYYYYFLCTMCIMEGAMLAFGAFLSFETRKVRIEALNDARQIGLCLYNVIILSVLVLILSILLDNQIALVYGIFSGFVILGTTTTLLIIFIPKMQSVFHPHSVEPGDNNFTQNSTMTGGTVSRLNRSVDQKTLTSQQSSTE